MGDRESLSPVLFYKRTNLAVASTQWVSRGWTMDMNHADPGSNSASVSWSVEQKLNINSMGFLEDCNT